jgi:hypothetical protein
MSVSANARPRNHRQSTPQNTRSGELLVVGPAPAMAEQRQVRQARPPRRLGAGTALL